MGAKNVGLKQCNWINEAWVDLKTVIGYTQDYLKSARTKAIDSPLFQKNKRFVLKLADERGNGCLNNGVVLVIVIKCSVGKWGSDSMAETNGDKFNMASLFCNYFIVISKVNLAIRNCTICFN
jgi:hypothetical protein